MTGYRCWEEALEKDEFSAAVIASPAPWHIPTAQALTDRGLDLLIEKPLSLNTDGVSWLAETIEKQGTRVTVGFVYRRFPRCNTCARRSYRENLAASCKFKCFPDNTFPFTAPPTARFTMPIRPKEAD